MTIKQRAKRKQTMTHREFDSMTRVAYYRGKRMIGYLELWKWSAWE